MYCTMNYGKGAVEVCIPGEDSVDATVVGSDGTTASDLTAARQRESVKRALQDPIGSPPLSEFIGASDTVCIVTSDITRPMPTRMVLPVVLKRLDELGVSRDHIDIIFALGMHRPHKRSEKIQLVGEKIFSRYSCADSDPDDVIYLGDTEPAGTAVYVYRPVVEADRIICLGNVEYHYFAGYSGGLKAILPGTCGRETVHNNHRMMFRADAQRGILKGNPVREDIDSVAELIEVDFIVNVIVDDQQRIESAVAGAPLEAHRHAARLLDSTKRISLSWAADLVLADAGGYPKDVNLYQAQKALDSAASFAAEGAPIVLLAECSEGYGNEIFNKWLSGSCRRDVRRKISRHFELGGHKAAALSALTEVHPIWLMSQLGAQQTQKGYMRPLSAPPPGEALHLPPEILRQMYDSASNRTQGPKILILPSAGSFCAPVE